jgi:hypothetical protein
MRFESAAEVTCFALIDTRFNDAPSTVLSFFLNRPLLHCGVEGFLLMNPLDNW